MFSQKKYMEQDSTENHLNLAKTLFLNTRFMQQICYS